MARDLRDVVVVITGASSGMGRCAACLRQELADAPGIQVTSLLPEAADTPIFANAAAARAGTHGLLQGPGR